MWAVAPAHRLGGVADELAEHAQGGRGGTKGKRRRRGHSRQSDDAFAAGLAHATGYARDHGSLAVRKDAVVGSFKLGEWLSNQQARAWALAPERVQALEDLDPWWNVPWPMQWQRSYYRARDHAAVDGPPDAAAGFPGTAMLNGEWLYLQCTQYASLHPEQRRLLADIGITAAVARAARPRRRSIWAGFETALEHARSYVAENGHLAVTRKIAYEGYPLGTWVASQRSKARKAAGPTVRSRALDAVDPWWNPPWPLAWHRTYAHARRLVDNGHRLEPDRGFPGLDADLALWLSQQCTAYQTLHPGQQQLLAGIGLTTDAATAVQIPIPASAAESGWKAAADPGRAAGMSSARSFAAAAGHLAVPHGHVHHGYPLGQWLAEQRGQDRRYQQAHGSVSPRGQLLAELDPWWNPPWHYTWQRYYQQARHEHREGRLVVSQPAGPADLHSSDSETAAWLSRQCARHDALHPEQQNLLADVGITATLAHAVSAGARHQRVDTGLAHARAYAAIHGNLAVPGPAQHNGFPLGAWLLRQRHRAPEGRTNPARIAALNALDPHWNPPWPLTWQRAFHRVRTTTANGSPTRADQRWITTQTLLWDSLHPAQQQLLTHLGAGPAQALPAPAPTSARRYPAPAGLPHARTYATTYGNLAVPTPTQHNGFALGRWLLQQRRKARTGRLSPRTRQELATLDPWWNPPWPFNWQTTYHQHHTALAAGQPITPHLQHWAHKQTTAWDQLHPHQQALLADAGIPGGPSPKRPR
nr:helicase associated domain-containing protein [Streptomyces sp. CBMA29]